MPELPEVETIRSQLSHFLPLKIQKVTCTPQLKKNILHTNINVKNKTIIQVARKGKMLDFIFADGSHLLSHLGMTGTWLAGENIVPSKHTHLILSGAQYTFAYDDPRRFGHLYYYKAKQAAEKLSTLGLDLLDPAFDLSYLTQALQGYPEKPLKVALLDQKLFAGTGNYIANEICARAKILPMKKCKNIKTTQFPKIFKALHKVISDALSSGGATFQGGYRDSKGHKGKASSNFLVFYQKTCQACKKNVVKKIFLMQRGTYYCPHCQR